MSQAGSAPSLPALFAERGDTPFLLLESGETVSHAAFLASARAMAANLQDRGLTAGDRIVVRLSNGEPVLRLYLAAALAGIAVCPVDPTTPAARISKLTRDLGAKLSVDDGTLGELAMALNASFSPPSEDWDRDFVILFSSGTTGEPKGIVHSVATLSASARSFAALSGLSPESVVYAHFPMFYMAGIFNLFFCPLMAGARIAVGPRFSNQSMLTFWETPKRLGVNHLTLTPTMGLWLSQLYRSDDELLDHMQRYETVISTGSSLYPAVARRFMDTFGVPLQSCYGVTEVGGSITLQGFDSASGIDGSVGEWRPEVEIDCGSGPDDARPIRVRTPFMCKGYWKGGALVPAVDAEGFFDTGDVGYAEAGILTVTGRSGDVLKKGGEFVSLVDLENLVLGSPLVSDTAAVGVPDEYWGNRIVLFVVPAAGVSDAETLEKDLQTRFQDGLRRIEQPDRIMPVPFMPKTSIGKTLKRALVERYTL